MSGGERQAQGAAARVADEMKAVEAGRVRGPQDAVSLVLERVPGGRCRVGVDLELLRDGLHVVAERGEQRAVGELGWHDAAGQEDRLGRHGRPRTSSMKASTSVAAGSIRCPPPTSAVRALGSAAASASTGSRNSGGESAAATNSVG